MARKPKRSKEEILSLTEKWPLDGLSPEQEALLIRLSDGLREYGNDAIEAEQKCNDAYLAALKENPDAKPEVKRHLSDFDLYTRYMPMREADEAAGLARARVPANWVLESCFRKVAAAYKSFFALLKRGDYDAHTPKPHKEWEFVAIQGALSSSSIKGDQLVLAPQSFPNMLAFPIPAYQQRQLARRTRLAKFVITRDEPNLNKPGRYWVSVAYEIPMPASRPFVPEDAVFIAFGASSLAIVSAKGEEVIDFWRADAHWKPEIEEVAKVLSGTPRSATRPALTKGSRKWRRIHAGSHKVMNRIMAAQQKQDRREVAAYVIEHPTLLSKAERRFRSRHLARAGENELLLRILGHGFHFVLKELPPVRSKEGKLADHSKSERGGMLGANWSAQNTGSLAYFPSWLAGKVREHGGSVRTHLLSAEALPDELPMGRENKLPQARALRDDFLRASATLDAA